MARYSDTVVDQFGNAVSGVQISVYPVATPTVLATLTDDAAAPLSNPVATDASGLFYFNAATGDYILSFKLASASRPFHVETVNLNDAIRGDLALSTGSTLIGHSAGFTGAATRTVAARLRDAGVFSNDVPGFDATGATDSYAAIVAGLTAAMDNNLPYIMGGSPVTNQTIFVDRPVNWRFGAGNFKPGFLDGQPYLRKGASVNGPCIVVLPGAYASVIENGGLLCDAGNQGDAILILGNTVTIRNFGVQGAGRDNIRIGGYSAAEIAALPVALRTPCSPTGINANCWSLDHVTTSYAVRDGFHLDDMKDPALLVVDSNTGTANRLVSTLNGRHGLYANHTYLGSEFKASLYEGNTGWGAYFDTYASGLLHSGGDIEANTAGNVYEARARANR